MRIIVAAVGRLKRGPETELSERYRKRAAQTGRQLGFRDIEIVEIKESRAGDTGRRMGARFTASEQGLSPVLREAAKRGLIYVDDGANSRSIAGQLAGGQNLPFAKADIVIDTVPTPVEIDRALARLEMRAREGGTAVGYATAQPGTISRIAEWAKKAEAQGIMLVPITMVAIKAKSS